jgi:N-acetylglutamate synthase/N-acetylornithine aminotransferase
MSDPGKDDRVTRYLMYKTALQGSDPDLGKIISCCGIGAMTN